MAEKRGDRSQAHSSVWSTLSACVAVRAACGVRQAARSRVSDREGFATQFEFRSSLLRLKLLRRKRSAGFAFDGAICALHHAGARACSILQRFTRSAHAAYFLDAFVGSFSLHFSGEKLNAERRYTFNPP